MIYPFDKEYRVSTPFGIQDPAYANYPGSRHPGVDLAAPNNTPTVASIQGKVTLYPRGNQATGRGNEVVISSGNRQVKYCHLNRIDVVEGQDVVERQQIGLVGWTGYVLPKSPAGAHLHFELLINGTYVDPLKYIDEGDEDMPPNRGDIINMYRQMLNREPDEGTINIYLKKPWKDFMYFLAYSDEFTEKINANTAQKKLDKIKDIVT